MNQIASAFFWLASSLLVGGCGSSVVEENPGSGGNGGGGSGQGGGQGGAGGQLDCSLPPPGAAFAFRINNVGTRELGLAYGCGKTLPIQIDTADGPRGIGAGSGDYCEIDCDTVYGGYENWGCSDCGPGSGVPLVPGEATEIPWDRRVYVAHQASAECTGHPDGNGCALGVPVGDATSGTLTFCTDAQSAGYCFGAEETVTFALDLSLNEVTIDIQ